MTGDSVYGADHALRRFIEKSGRGYVMAVSSAQRLGFKPVADWLEDVGTWQRLSAGEGAKGPRLYKGLSGILCKGCFHQAKIKRSSKRIASCALARPHSRGGIDLYRFRLGRTVVRFGCASPSSDRFAQQAAAMAWLC